MQRGSAPWKWNKGENKDFSWICSNLWKIFANQQQREGGKISLSMFQWIRCIPDATAVKTFCKSMVISVPLLSYMLFYFLYYCLSYYKSGYLHTSPFTYIWYIWYLDFPTSFSHFTFLALTFLFLWVGFLCHIWLNQINALLHFFDLIFWIHILPQEMRTKVNYKLWTLTFLLLHIDDTWTILSSKWTLSNISPK